MLDEIKNLLDDVSSMSQSAYLYGSQIDRPDPANDVDLLFVIESGRKKQVVRSMQRIQATSKYLLHPTFVSEESFRQNPYFAVLIKNSVRLW